MGFNTEYRLETFRKYAGIDEDKFFIELCGSIAKWDHSEASKKLIEIQNRLASLEKLLPVVRNKLIEEEKRLSRIVTKPIKITPKIKEKVDDWICGRRSWQTTGREGVGAFFKEKLSAQDKVFMDNWLEMKADELRKVDVLRPYVPVIKKTISRIVTL